MQCGLGNADLVWRSGEDDTTLAVLEKSGFDTAAVVDQDKAWVPMLNCRH